MQNTPIISVILPIYNAELFLAESIDSILNQTYQNFELILLNDGSTDNSEKICLSYADSRIRYYKHANMGLAATLNKGIELSNGKYIARQDNDDISMPNRLEKQLNYLKQHPQVVLLGTRALIFSDKYPNYGQHNHPTSSAILKFDLLFDNPFVHSSVMFSKELVQSIGGYSLNRDYYEDHHLWSALAFKGKVANLAEHLVKYRHHEKGLSKITSYYEASPLFNQTLYNLNKLLVQENKGNQELAKLYHHNYTLNDQFNFDLILSTLTKIKTKLIEEFPEESMKLEKRYQLYKKVLQSRYNMFQRKTTPTFSLKQLWLKIEHKLFRYKSTIYD